MPGYRFSNDGSLTTEELRAKFEDVQVRQDFIRKVLGIVTGQLMFTFFFIFLTSRSDELKQFLLRNPYLWILSAVVTIVIIIVIGCCQGPGRKVPLNYILLGIFTIAETIMMCFLTLYFNTLAILIAVGMTGCVCLFATIIACFSKWDFTSAGCACFLLIMGLVMLIFGIVLLFIPHTPILMMVFASMGAVVFTFYLIFDIQMMIGGKHSNAISPEDYIFASISIYMDIIMIFQYILIFMDACGG